MWRGKLNYFIFAIALASCRKPYEPPAIQASNHFIVISGVINTGANSSTTITINRSLNLHDSIPNIPVLSASVLILSDNGAAFPLMDSASNGNYVSTPLTLDPTHQYRVSVTTSDGNKYLSDLVTPKISPPIDSVIWQLGQNAVTNTQEVSIFVNTHDPNNNTHYYRWDYIETYQYRSFYKSSWYINGGLIYPITDSSQSVYNCWVTDSSATILLGSSINLSTDVISHAPIANFIQNDPKMDVKYSILVRQYPLDLTAYTYWLTIQNNSQSLGGLFDLQPSQINGNVFSTTDTKDPVLGYVSASSITEMRLFIDNSNLGWKSNPGVNCPVKIIPQDTSNFSIWNYPDTSFGVYYFSTGIINITFKDCLDCRYQGGTNVQPIFWQ
jgi:hypothetical protein